MAWRPPIGSSDDDVVDFNPTTSMWERGTSSAGGGAAPILAPDAKDTFIGDPTDPTYGEFRFDTTEANEVFSFKALNVDEDATFAVVAGSGPAPTINSASVTPGVGDAFDVVQLDLDTSGMDEPGDAFILIKNPNGGWASIQVLINAPD